MSCFPCHSWNIFAGYRILECEVFSNSWKCCLFFMSTMVFDEKSSIIWIAFFPISKVSFYLFDFKIFFFIYFSDFFLVTYLGLNFFVFILFGVCATSWSCRVFFAKFWGFHPLFWTLFNPSFFLLCWNSLALLLDLTL